MNRLEKPKRLTREEFRIIYDALFKNVKHPLTKINQGQSKGLGDWVQN